MASKKPVKKHAAEAAYYDAEVANFRSIVKHTTLVGNRIGRRDVGARRGYASWLFVRAIMMAKTIENAFEPIPTGFGNARWLDHGSIAILCRALIECVAVMLYIGDIDATEDEWECRRHLFALHEHFNRVSFLNAINFETDEKLKAERLSELKQRLGDNAFFKTIEPKRQKRLLSGDDMYVEGRHEAMLKFGWGEALTRGVYKYLSNQSHSLPMAFSRTAANDLYVNESAGAKVTAGFCPRIC